MVLLDKIKEGTALGANKWHMTSGNQSSLSNALLFSLMNLNVDRDEPDNVPLVRSM